MALTQMMQHWVSVKEKYKDCLIFYRLGDFYEMFFDDAVTASEILDLTLTGKDCGLEERAPMCGVPYHAVGGYISKLVAAGYKVAICEQLEDPSQAKGMVDRGVVRVVTAGTLTSDDGLDEKTNNFICSVYKNAEGLAIAWADITTGDFCASEFFGHEALNKCVTELLNLDVKEIICNNEMLLASKDIPEVSRGILPRFSNYPEWAFGYSAAERNLLEQLHVNSLSVFSISERKFAISACGALLEYLKETQMHGLRNISEIKFISNENFLQLDSSAVRNLEIFRNLNNGGKHGSLYWLLDKTVTGMGSRFLHNALIYPLCDKSEILYRQNGVSELVDATVVRVALRDLLKDIKDIERIAGKISNGNVMPKDCKVLAQSLSVIPELKFRLTGFTSDIINDISGQLVDMSQLTDLLKNSIAEELPGNMKEGGYIKEGFNKQLDEYRNIERNTSKILIEMETRERDATGIRTLKIGYNRVFGYYIEVSRSFKDKVPLGYQRRQTLANAERYITDELKELEDKILKSTEEALKLEVQLYEKLKEVLVENIVKIKSIAAAIGLLDFIVALAEVSKANKYVRPEIVDFGEPLVIGEGRHPVVEAMIKDRFIPNDLYMDEDESRTLIITGPNMAGKSTYMRQTAIIVYMAHLGCFVPAKSAKIPLVDRIFTRIGASDNLINNQSTFMVEMIEVATIMRNATRHSLLILDEVGRGTSTYDGLSIAWAVIEYLTRNVRAKTLFATHYHELTELENKVEGVKNYKIAVKEINGSVVFLRKIMRGGANRSFGIEVASLAGVPSEVTDRAKELLKTVERGYRPKKAEEAADEPELSEVEKIISEIDMNNLSPIQAFMLLGDLAEKVKNEKN